MIESKDDLLGAIRDELEKATDAIDVDAMHTALAYYDAELPGVEEDDIKFSDFVSPEIRNAVEATLAEILPGFSQDLPARFSAADPADERQADLESHIVNHVIMTVCHGYDVLNRVFKDALILGAGVAKATWDTSRQALATRAVGVPEDAAAMLVQSEPGAQIVEQGDTGFTIDITKVIETPRPQVTWIPLDEFLVNADHQDISFDEARFVCHRRQVSASDLIAAGVDPAIVEDLQHDQGPDRLGRHRQDEMFWETETGDESTRLITICESYYRIDLDGDGIAELRRIITAGGSRGDQELLQEAPWAEQPFIAGVAFYAPRGWRGVSLVERLKDIQTAKSEITRQILDTGWRNLFGRLGAVDLMVNPDDLLTSRKGGVVRMRAPDAVVALPDVQLPQSSFSLLELLDKARRESGASAIDGAQQVSGTRNESAYGIERLLSAVEVSNGYVARNLAHTFVSNLYLKVHRLLRSNWPEVVSVKIENSWLQAVPAEWAERNNITVESGLATGDRMRQLVALQATTASQMAMMSAGLDGVLVDAQCIFNSSVDTLRLQGVRNAHQYFVDPASEQGQAAAQQKAQAAEQAAAQQQQMAETQAQILLSIENLKADTQKYKADLEHIAKVNEAELKLIELNAKFDFEEVPDAMLKNKALRAPPEESGTPKPKPSGGSK